QSYVCGVNCKGVDNKGYEYNGASAIIDFKGKDIGVVADGLLYARLSKDKLEQLREKFPAYADADYFKIL
ncbi:MAG: nitrilase family protein, partial [Muribaculaceae bacterium]|nr:nitrilase family protein [Muribaculaceae bacterium]